MSEINNITNITNKLNTITVELINNNNNIDNIQNILFEIQTNMSILSDYYLKYGTINDLSNNIQNLLNN